MIQISDIRLAFQSKLALIAEPLPTKWDNLDFTPVVDKEYQKASLVLGESDDMSLAFDGVTNDTGFFQIDLMFPTHRSPNGAELKAYEIAEWFKRGTRLTKNNTLVSINKSPQVKIFGESDGRYVVIVTIYYEAQKMI